MHQCNCTTEFEASRRPGRLDNAKRASHINRGPIGAAASAGNQVGTLDVEPLPSTVNVYLFAVLEDGRGSRSI